MTSLSVMVSYIFLGIGFGVLLNKAGYGFWWSSAMAGGIFAGALQYVGVDLLQQQASLLNVAITSFAVQARHLFYGISMVETYSTAGKLRPYMAFGLTDETYSLLCQGEYPEGEDPDAYRFLVTAFNHSYWITGCILGALAGRLLPFNTDGIEFSMTALFIASFVSQWQKTQNHGYALIGLLSSAACLAAFGPDNFLIPDMIVIMLLVTLWGKKKGDI